MQGMRRIDAKVLLVADKTPGGQQGIHGGVPPSGGLLAKWSAAISVEPGIDVTPFPRGNRAPNPAVRALVDEFEVPVAQAPQDAELGPDTIGVTQCGFDGDIFRQFSTLQSFKTQQIGAF